VQQSSATPDGVLLVDKAAGMTSHDVVALVRRRLQIRKVGHCGTLDPIATGLLLLTLGRGTKIQDLLMAEDKEYSGTMMFGATTSTQDKEGEIIEQREVPPSMKKKFALRLRNFVAIFIKPRQWSPPSNTPVFHFTNSRAREKQSSASRG
jgi:Pseudouridine synthase